MAEKKVPIFLLAVQHEHINLQTYFHSKKEIKPPIIDKYATGLTKHNTHKAGE